MIKNWKITCEDYAVLVDDCLARGEITCDDNTFIYVDPPYNIKDNLYGHKGAMHKGFDHARFADVMDDTMGNVMISYNNHPDIVQRFEEWHQYDFAHTYTMRSTGTYMIDQTKRRELICLNYGKYEESEYCLVDIVNSTIHVEEDYLHLLPIHNQQLSWVKKSMCKLKMVEHKSIESTMVEQVS